MFGFTPAQWNLVETELIQPLKSYGAKVWVFGSRARGTHQPFSDLDVMYELGTPLPAGQLFRLKSFMEDSSLPCKIDLVDVAELAESYRADVDKDRIAV